MNRICAACCSVLIVEDEPTLRLPLHDFLESKGARVVSVGNGTDGIAELVRQEFDLVFTDIRMPGADGFQVLARALERAPNTSVVVMTGFADVDSVVRALRGGAYDYLAKPFTFAHVEALLARHCRQRKVVDERDELRREVDGSHTDVAEIVACSKEMQTVLDTVQRVAASDTNVVLLGETGTGKELVAEALHRLSRRRSHRLIKFNCAAMPDSLIESELFGHERGAFTGAVARKRGRFEMADGGTLFLDEIGDLSATGQAKVLRAIQERTFERVGGTETIHVDTRFVAASHRDLRAMVRDGTFREDLYYRLSVITIDVPALRDRPADIPLLVEKLLVRAARQLRVPLPRIAPRVLEHLNRYRFPGNVRELANLIERAATLCDDGVIDMQHFPAEVVAARSGTGPDSSRDATFLPLGEATARFEEAYIATALRHTGNRRAEAAQLLGISRKTLWSRLHGSTEEPSGGDAELPA